MIPYRRATRLLNIIIVCALVCILFFLLQQPHIEEENNEPWKEASHTDLGRVVAQVREVDDVPGTQLKGNAVDDTEKAAERLNEQLRPPQPAQPPETRDGDEHSHHESSSELTRDLLGGWGRDLKKAANVDMNVPVTGRQIVDSVHFLNREFSVLNTAKYGPVENVKTVIVIQVHSRLEYLKYLVDTLSKTKGIEETLIVFSHDVNIEEIDDVVRNITFARVLQIFYPYNIQLFPLVFPGQDPRDCEEKMKKDKAEASGCRNWEWPDKYGNYRVARFTQIKHHWWWKMNYVFDGVIERFGLRDRWVLLLEEDHYVSPDALHVLDYITTHRKELCAECELISLGFYLKSYASYGLNIDRLGVHPWFSSKHNMGMALRADTWDKVKNCSELFCSWDDYNWDWSLLQISVKCVPQRFKVIFAKAPRVLHVGDCGVHTHRCAVHNAAEAAAALFSQHADKLFPSSLKVTEVSRRMLKPSKENGGWGDKRDRELCGRNTHPLREPMEGEQGFGVLDDLLTSSVAVQKTMNASLIPYPAVMPRG